MYQGTFDLIILLIIKLLFFVSIFTDAKGDAVIDETKKRNHGLELLSIAALGLVMIIAWWFYDSVTLLALLSYVLMRMGSFNLIYNKYRNLDYYYVGTTDKWYDKWIGWMSKIESQPRKYKIPVLSIWYFITFGVGFFLY